MIKCPFCKISYVDNTLYCSECGYYLLDDEKRETDELKKENSSQIEANHASEAELQPRLGISSPTLRLRIGPNKRIIETHLDKIIHIGRLDPHLNIFPEIDVTDDISPEKSVSRRHARMLKQGNKIVVEDLGSVNGTFINSKKLDPYLPEAVVHGDVLQLGTLVIEIEIIK